MFLSVQIKSRHITVSLRATYFEVKFYSQLFSFSLAVELAYKRIFVIDFVKKFIVFYCGLNFAIRVGFAGNKSIIEKVKTLVIKLTVLIPVRKGDTGLLLTYRYRSSFTTTLRIDVALLSMPMRVFVPSLDLVLTFSCCELFIFTPSFYRCNHMLREAKHLFSQTFKQWVLHVFIHLNLFYKKFIF